MTTQPTTRRRRQAPAPQAASTITPAVLKLIEQVRAEAEAATLEALSAKDGITVLHPFDREGFWIEWSENKRAHGWDRLGVECFWISQYHFDGDRHGTVHPFWLANITLKDGSGHQWVRRFGRMRMDDFGTLVLVES